MAPRDGITERRTASGEVRYRARWVDVDRDGRAIRTTKTFATREAAEDFLRLRRRRTSTAPATMTVAELIDETLARAADRLSERTILTYRHRADTMILPQIGGRRLLDLATIDVQRWIDGLGRSGYRPATIHAAVAVLFGCLRDAVALGLVERNVAQGIRRPRIRRDPLTTWTADEARRFLSHVRDDPRFGALWHTALATGMRPGELRALAWADVDLERRTLHVHRTLTKDAGGREVISEGTKRGKGRVVAIPAALATMLRRHRVAQTERRLQHGAGWWDRGLVFDRGDGHWVNADTLRRAQQAACKAAGVTYLTAHQMRHAAASLLLEQGVSIKVVADMLGHASVTTTADIYMHSGADMHRQAVDALGAALFAEAASDE